MAPKAEAVHQPRFTRGWAEPLADTHEACRRAAQLRINRIGGFPHSEIVGSKVAHTSPTLIAACHVLHRLYMPRHPRIALTSRLRVHTTNDNTGSPLHRAATRNSAEQCLAVCIGVVEISALIVRTACPSRSATSLAARRASFRTDASRLSI